MPAAPLYGALADSHLEPNLLESTFSNHRGKPEPPTPGHARAPHSFDGIRPCTKLEPLREPILTRIRQVFCSHRCSSRGPRRWPWPKIANEIERVVAREQASTERISGSIDSVLHEKIQYGAAAQVLSAFRTGVFRDDAKNVHGPASGRARQLPARKRSARDLLWHAFLASVLQPARFPPLTIMLNPRVLLMLLRRDAARHARGSAASGGVR
jgi:hypothetical protein